MGAIVDWDGCFRHDFLLGVPTKNTGIVFINIFALLVSDFWQNAFKLIHQLFHLKLILSLMNVFLIR